MGCKTKTMRQKQLQNYQEVYGVELVGVTSHLKETYNAFLFFYFLQLIVHVNGPQI